MLMKILFFFILFVNFFLFAIAQEKIYVAPNGNDNQAGTITKPLKTLEAALNKVASAKSKMVTIFLRAGRYAPAKTIDITPALLNNHHLQIAAYNNEAVTVTGAVKIAPQWKPYKN